MDFFEKNKWSPFIWGIILLSGSAIRAQNLIPDPTFDVLSSTECIWPGDVWQASNFWYIANPTPDWFIEGCAPHPNSGFWGLEAGRGEAGLRIDLRISGFHYSESIGTPLLAPIEDGKLYYFEMDIRNKGLFFLMGNNYAADCTINPEKDIRVYTAADSIFFMVDELNQGALTTNAQEVLRFQEAFLAGSQESFMETLGQCFVGDPSIRHLAIAPRFGTFEVEPPCMLIDSVGFFNIAYYALDNISLLKLPEQIDTTLRWCTSESNPSIDLSDLFDERALKSISYSWKDGHIGTIRTFEESGLFEGMVELSCGEIPISIDVEFEICEADIFVPNAFSPNDDGINDTFGPFINSDFPITSYSFKVFDRWGSLLFQSNTQQTTWNGDALGRAVGTGVYVWVLEYGVERPGGTSKFKEVGEVLVVR